MLASRQREQDFGTVAALVAAHAAERPDAPALVAGPRQVTYGAFDRLIDRAAAGFQNRGLAAGDVAALLGLPPVEHLSLHLGALRAGLVAAPLADGLTRDALISVLEDARAKLLLTDPSNAGRLAPLPTALEYDVLTASEDGPLANWSLIGRPHPIDIKPEDACNIIYAPHAARGEVVSYGAVWRQSVQRGPAHGAEGLTISDPLYCNTTMIKVFEALAHGARVVVAV